MIKTMGEGWQNQCFSTDSIEESRKKAQMGEIQIPPT